MSKSEQQAQEANRFERTFQSVVEEIQAHPEIWVGCKKNLHRVAERLRALETPPMRLIHGETIARLGRLPKSDEVGDDGRPHWITLEEMLRRPRRDGLDPIVAFASHRWVGGVPDIDHSKARAIAKFTNYHRTVYQRDSYWWVDYTCMDQHDVGPHIAALPLYIAASEEVIAFFSPTSDYRERGWIRCELALSATLNSPRAWRVTPIKDDAAARAAALESATDFVTPVVVCALSRVTCTTRACSAISRSIFGLLRTNATGTYLPKTLIIVAGWECIPSLCLVKLKYSRGT